MPYKLVKMYKKKKVYQQKMKEQGKTQEKFPSLSNKCTPSVQENIVQFEFFFIHIFFTKILFFLTYVIYCVLDPKNYSGSVLPANMGAIYNALAANWPCLH